MSIPFLRLPSHRLPFLPLLRPTNLNPLLRTLSTSALCLRIKPTPSSLPSFRSARRCARLSPPRPLLTRSITSVQPLPASALLTSPIVARHLLIVAGLVFSIVVVGGLTRLTESGLSITEWNLVSGVLPPLTEAEWASEFEKYQQTPEWRLLNQAIELEQFKVIYGWEWAHRFLGRLIGLTFLAPLPFFFRRGSVQGKTIKTGLLAIAGLIGAQGALGWYMVQSGLDQAELDSRDGVPRVSQYRLAAHLGMAFTVYATCIRLAGGILRDWQLGAVTKGLGRAAGSAADSVRLLESKLPVRARKLVNTLTALVFFTAVSGAFVAGLDAGLVYNTFPLMGGRLVPPQSELFAEVYTERNDGRPGWVRNLFENPTTVQFDHRLLASVTFGSTVAFWAWARRHRALLPPSTYLWARGMLSMACVQVGLGISTLVYLVPTTLAAAHQAGSLVLLSLSLGAGLSLRRPNRMAIESLRSMMAKSASATNLTTPIAMRSSRS